MGLARPGGSTQREPGQFNTPHNIAIDRQNNVYVADRGNRRIQVFDSRRHVPAVHLAQRAVRQDAASGARQPAGATRRTRPQPWTICITPTPTQYLYATDVEPGRLYKLTLDGKIVGMLGESGHDLGQFNWAHGLACPSENTHLRRRHEQLARAEADPPSMRIVAAAVSSAVLLSGCSTHSITIPSVRAHEEFLASDAMNGRGSGTRDEWVAATYIASQLRRWGIEPLGDDGGYVQAVEVARVQVTVPPVLTAGALRLTHGKEMIVQGLGALRVSGPLRNSGAVCRSHRATSC